MYRRARRNCRPVVWLQPEPQPRDVARSAERPRGVVAERCAVQHPHDAGLKVGDAALRVQQLAESALDAATLPSR